MIDSGGARAQQRPVFERLQPQIAQVERASCTTPGATFPSHVATMRECSQGTECREKSVHGRHLVQDNKPHLVQDNTRSL